MRLAGPVQERCSLPGNRRIITLPCCTAGRGGTCSSGLRRGLVVGRSIPPNGAPGGKRDDINNNDGVTKAAAKAVWQDKDAVQQVFKGDDRLATKVYRFVGKLKDADPRLLAAPSGPPEFLLTYMLDCWEEAQGAAAGPSTAAEAAPPMKRSMCDEAPSALATPLIWERAQQAGTQRSDAAVPFQCFRPDATAQPALPVHLADPVLGRVQALFMAARDPRAPPLTHRDCSAAVELSGLMSKRFANEKDRQQAFIAFMAGYMERHIMEATIGSAYTDGCLFASSPGMHWRPLMYVQKVKAEMGRAGDSYFQCQRYYQMSLEMPCNTYLVGHSPCPALMLELVGPHLRISGLASVHDVVVLCQPFTPFLHLFDTRRGDAPYMEYLARTLGALRQALGILESSYRELAREAPCTFTREARDPALKLPHPLRDSAVFTGVERHPCTATKLVYRALHARHGDVVVKITDANNYGEAVHTAWAAAGFAPALRELQPLPGGTILVVMEDLSAAEGWQPFIDLGARTRPLVAPCVKAALQMAHEVAVADGKRGVHCDLRGPNVMVKKAAAGGWDVRFIDFDWAGLEGEARLPAFMQPRLPGMGSGSPATQAYDRALWEATWNAEQ